MEWRRRALLARAIISLVMVAAGAAAEAPGRDPPSSNRRSRAEDAETTHDDLPSTSSAGTRRTQSAGADSAEGPEPAPAITLPVARETPVTYPEGAHGEAVVTLQLVIGADGAVESATVVEGSAPFAEHAREAALKWRFEPATQDGRPRAAKIRFLVRFEPPASETESAEEEAPPEPPPGEAPAETAPSEAEAQPPFAVIVRGRRRAPGTLQIGSAEAQQMPGAFGDPFRAIGAMPGMVPVISGVPFFFVRGAPPGNTGFYLDGVPVPLLFHAFIGPAVIHPSLIDHIDLHRGGFPARYGRYSGGVVSAHLKPPAERFNGRAQVRLVDSGAYLAAPFASGRGHATVAGRYSYTGLVLSLLTKAVLKYWDYQARASYNLTEKDTVSVFGFGALDYASDDKQEEFAGTDFHRVDLRYDHRFARSSTARLAFTAGHDRSRATNGTVTARSFRVRTEIEHTASDEVELFLGADANAQHFDLEVTRQANPDYEKLFPSREDLVFGAYTDLLWTPEPWVTVEPGIRADVYRSLGNTAVGVDPRISATFSVTNDTRLLHSLGLIHQAPNFIPSLPGARVAGIRGGLQRALQSSAGIEQDLPGDITASLTFYDNLFFNLSDPLGYSGTISANVDTADVRALGSSIGAELLLRRDITKQLGGYLAYTLSRTVRSRGRLESLSAFDRTHILNAALAYDLGKHWRASGRVIVNSGVPVRTLTVDGPRFSGKHRVPTFARLDLRLEKRWIVNERVWWSFVAEMLNVNAAQQIVGRSCNEIRCTDSRVGPVFLPSLGVEVGF